MGECRLSVLASYAGDTLPGSSPPRAPSSRLSKWDAAQAVVLAPTREIALQVADALVALGAGLPAPGLAVGAFVGGLPTEEDVRRLRRCAARSGLFRAHAAAPPVCAPPAGPLGGMM